MSTITRTGTLYGAWDIPTLAHIDKCQYIILITVFAILVIEISTKKMTSVVYVENINSHDISAICILSLQMPIVVVVS
jgi:hypothetical protein